LPISSEISDRRFGFRCILVSVVTQIAFGNFAWGVVTSFDGILGHLQAEIAAEYSPAIHAASVGDSLPSGFSDDPDTSYHAGLILIALRQLLAADKQQGKPYQVVFRDPAQSSLTIDLGDEALAD